VPVIAVSGVDGSGKSTQIELLTQRLRAAGRTPHVFWFRPGYSDELNALRAAVRRLRPGALPKDGGARRATFARPGVRKTWVAAALADTLLQYAAKVRALSLGGHAVICDRYLVDGALDLALRFPELEDALRPAWAAVGALAPRPAVSLFLALPLDEAARRLATKDEPFPDPPALRATRHARYTELAAQGAFDVLVDAAPAPEVVAQAVWAAVEPTLGPPWRRLRPSLRPSLQPSLQPGPGRPGPRR